MMAALPGLLPNQIPVTAKIGNFTYNRKGQKRKDGKPKKVNITLEHSPLVPKFSVTSHKSQGMTLNKAFVDLVPVQKNPVDPCVCPFKPCTKTRGSQHFTTFS